jgi:hypothetical protein
LAAVIGVVDHFVSGPPVPDGHLQGIDHQLGAQMLRHGPADHTSAERIEDDREREKALPPRRRVGDVSDPQLVRRVRSKGTLNPVRSRSGAGQEQVRSRVGLRIALGRAEPAAVAANQTRLRHEARDPLAPTACPRRRELRLDARDTVRATTRLVNRADALDQLRMGMRPR